MVKKIISTSTNRPKYFFDRLPIVCLVFLVLSIPLAYSSITYYPTQIKNLVFGLGGCVLLSIIFLNFDEVRIFKIRNRWMDGLLLLFWVVNAVSLLMSSSHLSAIPYLSELGLLIFFFYAYARLAEKGFAHFFIKINNLALLFILGMGIFQILFHQSPWLGNKPTSFFGNPNFYGAYLIALWPVLLLGLRNEINPLAPLKLRGGKALQFISLIDLILFMINAVFIRSWAMVLSLGLSIPFLILIHFKNRRLRLGTLGVYGAFVIFIFQIPWVKESLVTQIVQDVRPFIWKGTLQLIQDHPLLGCGPGQYFVFYPPYRIPEYFINSESVDNTDHAHSEILELFAETGIIGVLVFILFLLLLGIKAFERAKSLDPFSKNILFSLLLGALLLYFENLFDVNLRYLSSKFVFWSFLGTSYGLCFLDKGEKKSFRKNSFVQRIICFSGVIVSVTVFYQGFFRPFLSEVYFEKGVQARKQGFYEKALSFYQKALQINQQHIEARYRMAFLYGLMERNEEAAKTYEKVIEFAPFFASVHGNLGTIYSRMGDLEKAGQHLLLQVRMNPYDPSRLCSLASVVLRTGQIEKGMLILKRVLLLDPKNEFAHEMIQKIKAEKWA
ncbi:MAG: tetratricopeptide repeat protein [Chlamydiae bacterium]|nr:tetratricopeptide repeat protein [Chlamydiota bacterium]MBI3277434.1 tetratricopeptide repeat protein [Chlamydiota bacterium]